MEAKAINIGGTVAAPDILKGRMIILQSIKKSWLGFLLWEGKILVLDCMLANDLIFYFLFAWIYINIHTQLFHNLFGTRIFLQK